jgi:hypothetical protein
MLTQALVEEAVRLTFEEMAFLDVAPGPPPAPTPESDEPGPVLYLVYSRPRAGSFALSLPKEIKFQVAESIYGEEWASLSSGQLDDSLLELMNVLAGRLLTENFPDQGYAMGLPTVLYGPPEPLPDEQKTTFPFHLDDQGFVLVWSEAVS